MTWTTKEINQVIRLRKAGCTTPEVAAMLGIPESRAKGYISVLVARGTVNDIAAELLVAIHKIYGALGEPHKEDFRETIESGMENGRVFDTRGGTDHA